MKEQSVRDLTWFKMLLLALILSFGLPVVAPSLLPVGIAHADDDDDDDDDFSVRRPEFVIAGLDDAARARLQARLSQVKDLGAPGRDPVFGWGLVQFQTPQGC
jgi:hypothetical protein